MLNFSEIQVFAVAAETENFSAAARRLHLSQPAVSQQITRLEQDYGTKLLHREGTKVVPTEEGKILYEFATQIIKLYERSKQAVREVNEKELSGSLVIGASTGLGEYLLPIVLARFKTEHANVHLSMDVGDSGEILERILQHRIDLGFVGVTRQDRHLRFTPFIRDRLVLVVSPEHELAHRRTITLKQFLKVPLVLQQPGSGATSALRTALKAHGLRLEDLNIVVEAGLQESTKTAVRFGLGATVISRLGVLDELHNQSLVAIEIRDLELEHDFYIACHRDWPLSRLAQSFIETARTIAKAAVKDVFLL